jgi:hydroxymethylpyrimidine pyrophosphatase-like HAD family hydrolase
MALRCLYVDLDGTLLGRGASLLHDGDGAVSLLGVRAIEACLRAGVEVVIMSGRRQAQVSEDARLLGQTAYIFEAGAGLVVDGDTLWQTGEFDPHSDVTIHDQIERTGAPALLLEHYADCLEYHDPWHLDREVSHLFRGLVDAFEADELLARRGNDTVRLVDNGVVRSRSRKLDGLEQVRAYHLVPIDASKAAACARHRRIRGYAKEECLAVGDSREDLGVAAHVGAFWFVANALERDPTLRSALAAAPNARVAGEGHGAGVYEAVVTTLAQARVAPPA